MVSPKRANSFISKYLPREQILSFQSISQKSKFFHLKVSPKRANSFISKYLPREQILLFKKLASIYLKGYIEFLVRVFCLEGLSFLRLPQAWHKKGILFAVHVCMCQSVNVWDHTRVDPMFWVCICVTQPLAEFLY